MQQLQLLLGVGQALGRDGVRLALLAAREDTRKDQKGAQEDVPGGVISSPPSAASAKRPAGKFSDRGGLVLPRRVGALLRPDVRASTVNVLEMRTYRYGAAGKGVSPGSSMYKVEGGYYRVAWECARDEKIKNSIKRLACMLGTGGGLVVVDIVRCICIVQRRLERQYVRYMRGLQRSLSPYCHYCIQC